MEQSTVVVSAEELCLKVEVDEIVWRRGHAKNTEVATGGTRFQVEHSEGEMQKLDRFRGCFIPHACVAFL